MANRAQRRKTKKNFDDDFTQSTKSTIITISVVLVIILLFYLLTVAINNKNRKLKTTEKEKTEATIQYKEILAESTFVMFPHEYYVMFYDFDGPEAVYLDYLVDTYASQENKYIYKVDLGNKFNQKFVSEETNKNASKASELKVKDVTLIKIQEGKNVSYVEGNAQVMGNSLK